MGRHHEVRAAAMAKTAKAKSAIYLRASKEIYMAAKGNPDPTNNLALRSAMEKYRKTCPRDVMDRAIAKAKGGDATNYIPGRYEAFGPGNSYLVIDTLTDNSNRALTEVRTAVTKKGGHMGSVIFNFEEIGLFVFEGSESQRDSIEEDLIMNDVDVKEVSYEDGYIEVSVEPSSFANAKAVLDSAGITDFDTTEILLVANEKVKLDEESMGKFNQLLEMLDDAGDVQAVYHNVEME